VFVDKTLFLQVRAAAGHGDRVHGDRLADGRRPVGAEYSATGCDLGFSIRRTSLVMAGQDRVSWL
jgi:hypothetical protein